MLAQLTSQHIAEDAAKEAIERAKRSAYALSPVLPHPTHEEMTLKRVLRAIEDGFGQGRDEIYQPWIRVRRRLCSPVSNLFVLHVPIYRYRCLHLMSALERSAAQTALWLGATEIREQFPLWPEEHLHPSLGRPWGSDAVVRGLLDMAEEARIRHGTFPGTRIPYVATTDMLLDVPARNGTTRLVAWPCKPTAELVGRRAKRVEERLKLEEIYASAVGAWFYLFTNKTISEIVADQLDWFMPRQLTVATYSGTALIEDFVGVFMRYAEEREIPACLAEACRWTGIETTATCFTLFRLACWQGLIPIDFSQHILMTRRIRLDVGFKNNLRNQLFGSI